MSKQTPSSTKSSTTRVRIHSHVTQSKFLHVEDSLQFGKLRLFGGTYRRSNGMEAHSHHFVDMPDARVIFSALAQGEQGFEHKEYKGTPPQKSGDPAISRVLSVKVKGQNVYIELKTGDGKLTKTGAITPNGAAKTAVNVTFKLAEARRLGATVLAYIHAWDVMRMMVHQEMVSVPPPYTLSPSNGAETKPVRVPVAAPKAAGKNDSATAVHVAPPKENGSSANVHSTNGRPVTRKTTAVAARKPVQGVVVKNDIPVGKNEKLNGNAGTEQRRSDRDANGKSSIQNGNATTSLPRLLYGDGLLVSMENAAERSAYARYRQVNGNVPPSKTALQAFYQQQA